MPEAEHLRETKGPGCNVWSMNEYDKLGRVSAKKTSMKILFKTMTLLEIFIFRPTNDKGLFVVFFLNQMCFHIENTKVHSF